MGMKLQRKRNLSAIYAPYIQNSELILILKLVSSRYIKLFKLLCFFFFWGIFLGKIRLSSRQLLYDINYTFVSSINYNLDISDIHLISWQPETYGAYSLINIVTVTFNQIPKGRIPKYWTNLHYRTSEIKICIAPSMKYFKVDHITCWKKAKKGRLWKLMPSL